MSEANRFDSAPTLFKAIGLLPPHEREMAIQELGHLDCALRAEIWKEAAKIAGDYLSQSAEKEVLSYAENVRFDFETHSLAQQKLLDERRRAVGVVAIDVYCSEHKAVALQRCWPEGIGEAVCLHRIELAMLVTLSKVKLKEAADAV